MFSTPELKRRKLLVEIAPQLSRSALLGQIAIGQINKPCAATLPLMSVALFRSSERESRPHKKEAGADFSAPANS